MLRWLIDIFNKKPPVYNITVNLEIKCDNPQELFKITSTEIKETGSGENFKSPIDGPRTSERAVPSVSADWFIDEGPPSVDFGEEV